MAQSHPPDCTLSNMRASIFFVQCWPNMNEPSLTMTPISRKPTSSRIYDFQLGLFGWCTFAEYCCWNTPYAKTKGLKPSDCNLVKTVTKPRPLANLRVSLSVKH